MATQYTVSAIPEGHDARPEFEIQVNYRGGGLWGARRWTRCLDSEGRWDYELSPSESEDEWLARHRFDLDTALRLAKEAAPHLTVNGHTVRDVLAEAGRR